MKISLFVTDTTMQFNLTPESEHEKDFMKLLEKYEGDVSIHNGVEVIETRGNYLRNEVSPKTVAIIVSRNQTMPSR